DPLYSRQIILSNDDFTAIHPTEEHLLEIQVMAARWSGHHNAQSDHYYYDLVVSSPLANANNSYGYVFAGDIIRAAGTRANPLSAGHALVDLQLFSTSVSSGEVNIPF